MTLRYLVDTNVLSEPAKPKPAASVVARFRREQDRMAMAAAVWNELVYGVQRLPASSRRRTLETYVRHVLAPAIPVLPYDANAAEWHAHERARLESIGQTPAYVDSTIAAVASTRGLTLVTRNTSNFEYFQDLTVENWFE
jgi:tRNA(fMet)-specific endonuclease VapC